MKKFSLMILLMALVLTNINCGGGVRSSNDSGKTMVNINLGKIRKAPSTEERLSKSTSSLIPPSIASIRFVISAPDMVTVEKVVSVAGKDSISEAFEILNGPNRDFLIEALDVSGYILYRKETFVNLDGTPLHLTIEMESTDLISPIFSGLSNINSIMETSLSLLWSPGNDNITPPEKIQYLIYMSTTPGGENFTSPSITTGSGVTSSSVTGLNPATTYYFVVRARDESGNIDSNSIERSATTLSPPDTTPPDFDGVVSVVAVSPTVVNLAWNPATDNLTPSSNIVYNIYMSTTPGGENFTSPSITTGSGVTSSSVTGLNPATTYYFVVRARDESGNIDSNSIERLATTLSPPDTTPPDFDGIVSVAAISPTVVNLSWNPATDNLTASSNIVYNIYMSTTPGGENFASPGFTTGSGATLFSVTGLNPATTYYFVVRAKDEAGNIDSNIVERSMTTAPILWAKSYGDTETDSASSIRQTSDGGYIVTGYTSSFGTGSSDFWVLKFNKFGGVEWQKTYGGGGIDPASFIQQTSDGGFIVAGSTYAFGVGGNDFWVLKLDSAGTVVWEKTYGGGGSDSASSIQQTSDGGYIVAGDSSSFVRIGSDIWILKLNSNGTIGWQKRYGNESITDYNSATSIRQTSDGGYIVAGYTFLSTSWDFLVLKINNDGTIVWQKKYGSAEADEYAYAAQQTSDGGYIVAGLTYSFGAGSSDFWVLKLDSLGTVVWQKTYGGIGYDSASSIQQTSDGGFIVAGSTNSFGAGSGDFWVLKLDSLGEVVWQYAYGGADSDYASSIQQISDGGYIVAGYTTSFAVGNSCEAPCRDFWILRLSYDGTITFNSTSGAITQKTLVKGQDTSVNGQNTLSTGADTNAKFTDTKATITDTNAIITQQAP